jgi:hypothetical protein
MKSAQRQFLVKVSGIDGYFANKTGGNVTAGTTKVYDGGNLVPDVMSSPSEVDNITVSRAFDLIRDEAIVTLLRTQVGRWRTTISVTPTNEDLMATGKPVVYADALLVGFTELEVDASGGDAATYELEFAVSSVA